MANISSAFGTVTFIVKGGEQEARYVADTIMGAASKWYYGMQVAGEDPHDIKIADGMTSISMDFDGSGRWGFENNVSYLPSWLSEGKGSLNKQDLSRLKNMEFQILFDYVDDEPGNQILYKKKEHLCHTAGTPLKDMTLTEDSLEEYEYTAKNLVDLIGYDLEDAQERAGN